MIELFGYSGHKNAKKQRLISLIKYEGITMLDSK